MAGINPSNNFYAAAYDAYPDRFDPVTPAQIAAANAKNTPAATQSVNPAPAGTDVTAADRTTTKSGTESTRYDTSTMSDPAQRAMESLLAQGGSSFQRQQQATNMKLVQDLQTRLEVLCPEQA